MPIPINDIPPVSTPGKEAWDRSVKVERLMLKLRDVAVRATCRGSADVALPDDFAMWAKDLRRGRMSIIGSFKRFVDLIEARGMGQEGRALAHEAWGIAAEYMDLALSVDAPKAEPTNTRAVDISSETRKARVVDYGPMSKRVANRSA